MSNVLNRLEQLFKTDVRYLLKGTLHLSVGQIFATLSGLLLTYGLTRMLDKADYGLYTYILSLAGIAGTFTLAGMDTAVAQAVAKGFDKVLIKGFWEKLRWSIPTGLITVIIGSYYIYKANLVLGVSLIIIGLLSPLLSAASLYGSYFNGKKLFKELAYDNALRNGAITVSILLTAYFTRDVIYVILAYYLSNTLISLIRYIRLMRRISSPVDDASGSHISLGKHLSVMSSFSNIATYIDEIIVFQLLGATPLALYALALAPTKQLQNVSKIINVLVLPKFSTRTARELQKSMPFKTFVFFLVSLALTICYWICAPFLFHYVFPKYTDALLYSQVLSLGLLFMPFILHYQALSTLGKKDELYIFNIAKPIIKILLLVIFIPLYGIWGAIIAFVGAQFINSTLLIILFKNMKT